MSYIAFESREGRVEIGGRARMGVTIDDLAWTMHRRALSTFELGRDKVEQMRVDYVINSSFDERLGWACLIGNENLRLLAHMHGQCEIHGWVHPDDLDWFAGLLSATYEIGLLGDDIRGDYGSWPDVVALARASKSPLVSSYSICSAVVS